MSRKTALITGAARGIGLATAHLMTQQGYQIAMVDKDEDELHKTVGDVDGQRPLFVMWQTLMRLKLWLPGYQTGQGRLMLLSIMQPWLISGRLKRLTVVATGDGDQS